MNNLLSRTRTAVTQGIRGGVDQFARLRLEAQAKAAANSLEHNQSKMTSVAAELYALITTVMPQVLI